MKLDKFNNMLYGCFIGNFEPSAYKTESCEVSYKIHKKGEKWDKHFHSKVTEINLLIRGKMIMNDITLNTGDIFTMYPYEVAIPQFLEDCEIICVKVPGIAKDKICFEILNDKK